ncbi:glycolipid 2-alpha-mannosyltransferase [Xylaria bambusicola]|uniref:glycolipid 2-alpha-mannosyltransferase n=1 Tax=Xylaria bambusicola TaxID=326684 RepID=UPI00200847DE|nr:glycolipid 2-alpha-mannosyltransferase [Xylaria bambusicola]KAI0512554.1 glycolipid 2-alpha-mannosyltransferase [Xylaria bambusicola]
MLLRRISRAARRLPFFLLLVTAAPFILEAIIHVWRSQVPRPARDLDAPFFTTCQEPDVAAERENAVLVMLARNSERQKAKRTVRSIEAHFNQWFEYPILFLNDEPWDARFIAELNKTAGGRGIFEVIPKNQWTFPDWLDQDSAKKSIEAQGHAGAPHAGKEGYHHMCRFYSGKFYQLEALSKYKWYWRLEPDVDFTCAITYDPFVQMAKHKKVYGYTIALWEVGKSCPGLFHATTAWKSLKGIPSSSLWSAMMEASWMPFPFRSFLSWLPHRDAAGDVWSLCHFWSNFEIADMDFFRSRAYQDYFEYLDKKGGFYQERWGDAAVHSLAIGMLADPQQVHHFEDIGYRHAKFYQCPANALDGQLPDSPSLVKNKPWSPESAGGIGCRCECDGKTGRNFQSYCLDRLKQPSSPKKGWFS